MVGAFRGGPGGIQGLLTLSRETWEAIESDLLRKGFTLADVPGRVSWRAVIAMQRHSRQDDAVFKDAFGDKASWTVTDHLLACLVDLSNMLVWMQSADGQKNRNRPKPIERPGDREDLEALPVGADGSIGELGGGEVHLRGAAMTPAEFDAWWNSN